MLTIEYAENPVWNDSEHTSILLDVKFAEFETTLPFTAVPYDDMPYGVELYNNALAGQYGEIGAYVPPTPIE